MRDKKIVLISLILIFLVVFFSQILIAETQIILPTNYTDTNSLGDDPSLAIDNDSATSMTVTASEGNITYRIFNKTNHNNTEKIFTIDVIIDMSSTGFTNDNWTLEYSADNGSTFTAIRQTTNDNVTRRNITLANLTETVDGEWSWNDLNESLVFQINIQNDSTLDGASMQVYEITLRVYYDNTVPTINNSDPINESYNDSNNVNLTYTVFDISEIQNCSLFVNGTLNTTNYNVTTNDTNYFIVYMNNSNYTWAVNCSDESNLDNISVSSWVHVNPNRNPDVYDVFALQDINLSIANQTEVTCNATVRDLDGATDISGVNATLYHFFYGNNSKSDDNWSKVSNASCTQTGILGVDANYTCGFNLTYYSKPDTWICNITAIDENNTIGFESNNTTVNNLFAMNISPLFINYSLLNPNETSASDEVVTITNLGNMELDVTLDAYALFDGDGLSMDCDSGNITVGYQRYSLTSGESYSSMTNLTDNPVQLDSFNLGAVNDTFNGTKDIYFKMNLPLGRSGNCTGFVTIAAVQS